MPHPTHLQMMEETGGGGQGRLPQRLTRPAEVVGVDRVQ